MVVERRSSQTASMHSPLEIMAAGALFGAAAGALLILNGRIAGVSGIAAQALETTGFERIWRSAFLAGLLAGGATLHALTPDAIAARPVASAAWLMLAGLAIGLGARIGNGCTSGHGVCGVGRLSRRSLAAVAMFTATGALVFRAITVCGGLP